MGCAPQWPIVAALIASSLAACIHRGDSNPDLEDSARNPPSAEMIRSHLGSREGFPAIRGMFKLKIERPDSTRRVSGALIAQRDSGVRIELFTVVGPPLAYAALSPSSAAVYLPMSGNTFLESHDPDRLLAGLSGNILSSRDLVDLFLGRPPPCKPAGAIDYRPEDDLFQVRCRGKGERGYGLALHPESLTIREISSLTEPDGPGFTCRLEDYRPVNDQVMPFQMLLRLSEDLTVEVQFTDLEVADRSDPAIFTIEAPADAQQLPLEALFSPR